MTNTSAWPWSALGQTWTPETFAGGIVELEGMWFVPIHVPLTRDITDEYHGGGVFISSEFHHADIDYEEWGALGVKPIAPPAPEGKLWGVLEELATYTCGKRPVYRKIKLEVGYIVWARGNARLPWYEYYYTPEGTFPKHYEAHMRDMQKYGVCLQYIAQHAGREG